MLPTERSWFQVPRLYFKLGTTCLSMIWKQPGDDLGTYWAETQNKYFSWHEVGRAAT